MSTKTAILIVEDSRTQAETLRALLEQNQFDVVVARSGEEAIAALEKQAFDIVISDIMMPGMSGYDLCRSIKLKPQWRDMPIMLLTSLNDSMDIIRGLECGADNFLMKPYDPDQLLDRIRQILENRKLRRSKLQVGLRVSFLGNNFTITADKEQILDLLISTFEDAVLQNRQLLQREEELERARAELARYAGTLEERIERVLESVPDIVYSVSTDSNEVYYISPACTKLLGCTPEQFVAEQWRVWERAIPAEHRERVTEAHQRAAMTGRQETLEYPIEGSDGKIRSLEETIVPVRDETGRIVRLDGIARDITERRRLEEQVRLAQKMEAVGTLAGGIAHDFNNLLTAIRGNAELTLMELPDGSPAREDIEQIHHLSQRATALTAQLLAFGRKQVLDPQAVDLNELITNSTAMLRRFIGADIEMRIVPTSDATVVFADPNQIDQILMNLSVNARHAMPEGGQLIIATSRVLVDDHFCQMHPWAKPGDYVCLNVTDTGVGMPPEIAARIFEPFFTTKEAGEGTGLGLAVVYGIVKQHGGFIHVYSEPGHGSTFKIYLPSHDAPAEPARETTVARTARGEGETILFAEDEQAVRVVVVQQLRRLGYNVLEASNGVEALELLNTHGDTIDLVMLDIVMPVMGGLKVFKEIGDRFPHLKFLFMTGYSPSTSHLTPLSGIPGRILHKPFGLTELAAQVRHAIEEAGAGSDCMG